jgi:ribosomal protein S18 acetylase RimI-like enzyme
MSEVTVLPAVSARVDDALVAICGGGGGGCFCQYWRMSSSAYAHASFEERETALRAAVAAGPAPGVVAYVDGEPAGWCGFGPRAGLERLVRSRTIQLIDDVAVWSIVCLAVRVGFRRRGVVHALLAATVEYARDQGAPALEAYPVDAAGARIHATAAYVGTMAMFEAAGFVRIAETAARSARLPRWLVRHDLRP